MHVQIDDHGPRDRILLAQLADGDRDIVEKAEPLAVIGERMMRTTREIARHPVEPRVARGKQRTSAGELCAPPERLGPGKTDAPLFRDRQPAGLELAQVAGVVHQLSVFQRDGLGLEQVTGRDNSVGEQPIFEQCVFAHRKTAAHGSLVLGMKAAFHTACCGISRPAAIPCHGTAMRVSNRCDSARLT